jgi:hypothetical protein
MFYALDADHSGSLDEHEAMQLARMLLPSLSEEQLHAALRQVCTIAASSSQVKFGLVSDLPSLGSLLCYCGAALSFGYIPT